MPSDSWFLATMNSPELRLRFVSTNPMTQVMATSMRTRSSSCIMPPLQPSKTPSCPPPRTHSLHNTKTRRRSWDRRSKPERSLKTMPARRLARKAGVEGASPLASRSGNTAPRPEQAACRTPGTRPGPACLLPKCRSTSRNPCKHSHRIQTSWPLVQHARTTRRPLVGATPCPSRRGHEASPMTRAGARKRPRPGAAGLSRAPAAHPRRTRRPARRRRT